MRRLTGNAEKSHFDQLIGQIFAKQAGTADTEGDDLFGPCQHVAGLLDDFRLVVLESDFHDILILRDNLAVGIVHRLMNLDFLAVNILPGDGGQIRQQFAKAAIAQLLGKTNDSGLADVGIDGQLM